MDSSKKNLNNIYGRVMPRVNLQSRKNTDNRSLVTRHKRTSKSSSSSVSTHKLASSLSSGVITELPLVLNDYDNTTSPVKSAKVSNVVKPRKTLKSMDVAELPPKATAVIRNARVSRFKSRGSAPSVVERGSEIWTDVPTKTSFSSRSQTKLRDIQEEISNFRQTEKQMQLNAKLFKRCGVVFDDTGNVKEDKGIQAESCHDDDLPKRRDHWDSEMNMKGDTNHMKVAHSKYPIDRYLDDRNERLDVDLIIPNDIWKVEPSIKPEDEIILRQLHEMLNHTAEDLKLLYTEMNQLKEPKMKVKSDPIPLDEEFNQKVHIEEVVSAKIHGNTIVESKATNEIKYSYETSKTVKNTTRQINDQPKTIKKTPRNLAPTKTKVLQIECEPEVKEKVINAKAKKNIETIAEYTFKHETKKPSYVRFDTLTIHHMPSVNIRSELKEQKVLHIDIIPDKEINEKFEEATRNVGVIELEHGENCRNSTSFVTLKAPVRKVSKLSTYESSESANNVSSDTQHRLLTQKHIKNIIRTSPKTSARSVKSVNNRKEKIIPKKSQNYLNEWKKKLNLIYDNTPNVKTKKQPPKSNLEKVSHSTSQVNDQMKSYFNNKDYIPYSQLTLGGVTVSDLEREVSDTPIKNDVPLSPIIDKILSSQENSPRKSKNTTPRILTTSDENLLQEVMDIEKQVQKTVSKTLKKKNKTSPKRTQQNVNIDVPQDNESYDDDFEEIEKSDSNNSNSKETVKSSKTKEDNNPENSESEEDKSIDKNKTYTKLSNLTMKDTVDIHEFVHLVDTNESSTQIKSTIKPQETQTSPKDPIKPIHNDLWSSIDPKQEVEKLFKIEKDLIKQLIMEEYGDLFEKNISKPTTSQSENLKSSQKDTQTSPAHVKNISTSPTKTKTRTTSPFNLKKDIQTSPFVEQDEKLEIEIDAEDLASSINMSSPRFSLRLPQTSRDVLSNLESWKTFSKDKTAKSKCFRSKSNIQSTSSSEVESSSDVSSLGEIKYVLRERLKKTRMVFTDSSTSLSDYPSGSILPLKSEGEISFSAVKMPKQNNLLNDDKSLGQL